ncbi:MAG: KAP family NTPase [Prolixibacteraceae bacterium]|nr:KAP family NTPase [Prolixibacteraceae bacterium]
MAEIKTVSSSESVVFGINGEWGEGKTSMINLIRKQLDDDDYTVVDFHPWKTNSGKAMNQLFFDALKDGLKNKIWGINWKIDRYADALLQLDKTGFGKALWQLFYRPDSVEKQKDNLAESMKLLDKNLVVVVDDLDRLAKNEIADVLKLMRDTANFPNLVFLAAYDRKYLEEAIQTEINKHNYQNYLDKIVLWEAPIYRPQPRKYINVLKELLEHKTNVFPKDEINDLFDLFEGTGKQKKERYSNPYEIHYALFSNLRDVKRFVGSLLFNYKTVIKIEEDVVVERKIRFRDFYYLYLLRFFFSDYYERFHIAYHELFTDKNEGKIETSYEKYGTIIFRDNDKDPNEEKIKSIITILIGFENSQAPATSIVWYKNFQNYFYLGNHQDITMDVFSAKLKAENFDEFKNKVEILIEDKETLCQFSFGEILSAVRINLGRNHEIKDFLSDYFQHLIWISSKINPPSSFRLVFNEISTSIPKVSSTFKEQDIEIIQHNMLNFIQKSNLDEIIQPLLALLIHKCKEDGSWERSWGHEVIFNTFLNIHEAISISKNNFINHVKEGTGISIKTVSLFYCCYQKIDENGKIVWDEEVIKPMRKLADQFPDDILPYFIGIYQPYINSDEKKPTWNRSLLAIFQTKENVKRYLLESNFVKEKMRAVIYSNYVESIIMIGEEIPLGFGFQLEPKNSIHEPYFSKFSQIEELKIGFK